jgi:hypothetical protein
LKEIAMTCLNPLTKMDADGRWRWYFSDDSGNPIFVSVCVFASRVDAMQDFAVMLPVIRSNLIIEV